MDPGLEREYIWATTHPFSQGKWASLHSEAAIQSAVMANTDVISLDWEGADFDVTQFIQDKWVQALSKRVWLLVMSEKQDSLSLTKSEVLDVWRQLKRKEGGL